MRDLQTIFLILIVTACIFMAGCVQSRETSMVPPAVTTAGVPAPELSTPVPVAVATSTPSEAVTIIRYVSPVRDLKDSRLLFALQVPAGWNVSTLRLVKSDTSDYRTDLVAGDVFSVYSFPITRSREQEFRDRFRQWSPAPVETTVTINDIRYDRYESSAGGNTTVAYLARATSANERGYGSVLVFVAHDGNRFEQEDFEKVISSFRYFSTRSAGTIPGEEIPHYELSGTAVSRNTGSLDPRVFDSSDWDTTGGSPAGSGSSVESSPGGGSTGGGHCGR
jgi:hypothetical protein